MHVKLIFKGKTNQEDKEAWYVLSYQMHHGDIFHYEKEIYAVGGIRYFATGSPGGRYGGSYPYIAYTLLYQTSEGI